MELLLHPASTRRLTANCSFPKHVDQPLMRPHFQFLQPGLGASAEVPEKGERGERGARDRLTKDFDLEAVAYESPFGSDFDPAISSSQFLLPQVYRLLLCMARWLLQDEAKGLQSSSKAL
ncbi:hypothetical protein NQZ68_041873 [Dissostichus eleginoides]|nr:hypothetical protein NQZ68_041873 [Dissostichus eleginoides]